MQRNQIDLEIEILGQIIARKFCAIFLWSTLAVYRELNGLVEIFDQSITAYNGLAVLTVVTEAQDVSSVGSIVGLLSAINE